MGGGNIFYRRVVACDADAEMPVNHQLFSPM